MLRIFKTPTCAYCVQVCKYLDHIGVAYKLEEAEGEEYGRLAQQFGMTVPLVFNPETGNGMVGYDISRLRMVSGIG